MRILKKKPKPKKAFKIKKTKIRVRGVSRKLGSKDKQKKTLCVFGSLDGKRVTFDDDTESFMLPVFGAEIRPGFREVTENRYGSTDFKCNGKLFRVFHPHGKTKDEVFQKLIDNYVGPPQIKRLKKKFGIPVEEIASIK
jgi:hypothetical protein